MKRTVKTRAGGGVLEDGLTREEALGVCLLCQGMLGARKNAEAADTREWLFFETKAFNCAKPHCSAGWARTKKYREPDSIIPGGWGGCKEVLNKGGILR